jgi:glycosyltransferase involved in cell wall biosynthesis
VNRRTLQIKVDVVIPVGPLLTFVPAALASVRAQRDVEWHIWLVDDGGPAEPADRLAQFAADDLTVLPNGGRPGIGGARNTGAAAGSAPLLAFLDSDDLWPSGRTAILAALLEGSNVCETLAIGMMTPFHGSPEASGATHCAKLPTAMLMPRLVWAATGLFDETLPLGEGIDWVARAQARGVRLVYSPEVVLWRRLHDGNTTLQRSDQRAAYVEVVRRHLRRRG